MRNLKLIIQREYLARVRNKTFIIMTFLSPLILVGMFALIAYLSMLNSSEQRIIGLYDETKMFASEFKDQEQVQYLDLSGKTFEEAKKILIDYAHSVEAPTWVYGQDFFIIEEANKKCA